MCGETFLVDIQIRDIFNLLNRWGETSIYLPSPGGRGWRGGGSSCSPPSAPSPIKGKGNYSGVYRSWVMQPLWKIFSQSRFPIHELRF